MTVGIVAPLAAACSQQAPAPVSNEGKETDNPSNWFFRNAWID